MSDTPELTCETTGQRIDHFLSEHFSTLSRSRLQKLIESGNVTVNDKVIQKANHKLKMGDRIRASIPKAEPIELKPENIPLNILFEDEQVIVLDKPAGLVVHPAAGNWEGTLVQALLFHCQGKLGTLHIGGELRPGIVHRIDKNTSGILVICKTDQAMLALSVQFKQHSIDRRYQAICWGALPTHGQWNSPIARDPQHRKKMSLQEKGKKALTEFKCLKHLIGTASLFEAKLHTGRTHQIRVHAAAHGFPLVGDYLYTSAYRSSRQKKLQGMKQLTLSTPDLAAAIHMLSEKNRQFLHASHLTFIHPTTKKELSFSSSFPDGLQSILTLWEHATLNK